MSIVQTRHKPDWSEEGTQAINWARAHGYTSFRALSIQPWSSVWNCISHAGIPSVLKAVKVPDPGHVDFLTALSKIAPQCCAPLTAAQADKGYYIFKDVAADQAKLSNAILSSAETLQVYGRLQSAASANPELLNSARRLDAQDIMQDSLALAKSTQNHAQSNPFALFAPSERHKLAGIMDRLSNAFQSLKADIEQASETINHTDLRATNLVRGPHDALYIIDWEDSAVSAPGWSLHNQFSGCYGVLCAAQGLRANRSKATNFRNTLAYKSYVAALCQDGHFMTDDLNAALPATAALGILKYVLDLSAYDISAPTTANAVKWTIASRFGDLSEFIRLYERLKAKINFSTPGAQSPLKAFPSVTAAQLKDNPIQRAPKAAKQFLRDGALVIENCFKPGLIFAAADALSAHRSKITADIQSDHALQVSDHSPMIGLDTTDLFGTPELLAEPALLHVLDQVLGKDYILGSLTAVLSRSKAKAEGWHRDNDPLFPEHPNMTLPPFSVALIVPLMDLDHTMGSTEILPGSHRNPNVDPETAGTVIHPLTKLGDAYLMDSRLLRRHMANTSDTTRPILSLVYQRPWYREFQNVTHQPTLDLWPGAVDRFPENRRHLVNWAMPR